MPAEPAKARCKRPWSGFRGPPRVLAFLVTIAGTLLFASAALAVDPDHVEWSADWPRVHLWEGLDIIALTVASYETDASWPNPTRPRWTGGILWDGDVRSALRGRSASAQATAAKISDDLYKGAVFAPYIVDVYFVALGVHQSADVAIEMALMNLQSLGLTGVVALASEHAVARARPYTEDCGTDGHACSSAAGTGDNLSFFSGHAAATATMAGLTCAHHQHLPLYGGGIANLAPCLVMMAASAITGIGRIVADEHWSTDVLVGWSLGTVSGYVVPSLLHYGFRGGRPVGEVAIDGLRMVPLPQAYPGGGGLGLAGLF